MDTILVQAGISTTGVAIILIVYKILKNIQGKKLISDCCGRKGEVGFSVQNMTPINREELKITIDSKEDDGATNLSNPLREQTNRQKNGSSEA